MVIVLKHERIKKGMHVLQALQENISRLTIVSCEAKKKQAVHDKRVSYLHIAPL